MKEGWKSERKCRTPPCCLVGLQMVPLLPQPEEHKAKQTRFCGEILKNLTHRKLSVRNLSVFGIHRQLSLKDFFCVSISFIQLHYVFSRSDQRSSLTWSKRLQTLRIRKTMSMKSEFESRSGSSHPSDSQRRQLHTFLPFPEPLPKINEQQIKTSADIKFNGCLHHEPTFHVRVGDLLQD